MPERVREDIEDVCQGSGGMAFEGIEGCAVGELGDEGWGRSVVEVEMLEGWSDEGE